MTEASPAAVADELKPWAYPNALRSSISYWWNSGKATAPQEAETALLERGLTPHGIRLVRATPADDATLEPDAETAVMRKVVLPGKDSKRFLNTLEMAPRAKSTDGEETMPIVCLHGYGGGTGFYFQQLTTMSSLPNTRTYFLDMLGMGFSGRPRFPRVKEGKRDNIDDVHSRSEQAERFFVDSLEEYREKKRFEKITLVGHSLGAYLSLSYALRYPSRVHKLILISPVGIPESPYASPFNQKEDADADELLRQEVGGDQRVDVRPRNEDTRPKAPTAWWAKLWEANISPFQVVRLSSFYGPNLVSYYAARRFALFPNDVQRDLFQYLYHICRERGSGEYALAHILAPGAYARYPMVDRITPKTLSCPVSFIYGEHDWMDPQGGEKVVEILKGQGAHGRQAKQSRVLNNPHSGHWVFLDNPKGFNSIILRELKEALADWKTSQA